MGKYKYEIHAHTAEVSSCGHVKAADAIALYKEAGYQGIVFTDHFNREYFDRLDGMGWEEMIDAFLEGYRSALPAAQALDMDVFWGVELRFTENDNDYLVYGLEEDFLKSLPFVHTTSIKEFMEQISSRPDILVFQAHPFRDGCSLVDPLIVDGLEVHNGNPRHDSRDALAAEIARENNLLILSGSDFHRTGDLATGGIILPERVASMGEFVSRVKKLDWESLIVKERVCR